MTTSTSLDGTKQMYSKLSGLPQFPYQCIQYLMNENEMIWKLLKHNSPDAWNKSNLSKAEKAALIYSGEPDATKFRVFQTTGIDDSWTIEACQLRISVFEATPNNYIWGSVLVGMEVYAHYKIQALSNYQSRVDVMIDELLKTFNGANIPSGLGRLFFDNSQSSRCRILPLGIPPMKGKVIIFGVHMV